MTLQRHGRLWNSCWAVFTLLLLSTWLISCSSMQETRHFRYTDSSLRATWVLSTTRLMGKGGAFIHVIETDARGKPLTGDTLRVWVQHYERYGLLYPRHEQAELIICCHPELLPENIRRRHVLPRARGIIMCADYDDGKLRVYPGSPQEHPSPAGPALNRAN